MNNQTHTPAEPSICHICPAVAHTKVGDKGFCQAHRAEAVIAATASNRIYRLGGREFDERADRRDRHHNDRNQRWRERAADAGAALFEALGGTQW